MKHGIMRGSRKGVKLKRVRIWVAQCKMLLTTGETESTERITNKHIEPFLPT